MFYLPKSIIQIYYGQQKQEAYFSCPKLICVYNNNNNNNKIFIYTRISKSNACKTVEKYIHTYTPQSHAHINKRKQQCKKCIQNSNNKHQFEFGFNRSK